MKHEKDSVGTAGLQREAPGGKHEKKMNLAQNHELEEDNGPQLRTTAPATATALTLGW